MLAAVSTVGAMALCEALLRVGKARRAAASPAWAVIADGPPEAERAARYVERLDAAAGTDRRWFVEDPPPLPNRSDPGAEREARYRDYVQRGLPGPRSEYVWNRQFLELERCAPEGFFRKYPATVRVFDAPAGRAHPRYRFPAGVTGFDGLVTNEFGLRGPPLAARKPPGTVRIAFLGASTTVCKHNFPFSYPDRVVGWLNRFAAANRYPVRFEVLNGGREALNSQDIARIFLDEILPLAPDIAVYYEGANQFPSFEEMLRPRIPQRAAVGAADPVAGHKIPEAIRSRLLLGETLDDALRREAVGEPRKPAYRIVWPAGVDERQPDPGHPRLPLRLPTILGDLDAIRSGIAGIGGRLALASYIWLASAGMELSPVRHKHVYEQLNTVMWPLRYADVRRLADFQNRVFERYAAARGVDFLDVAGVFPQDVNLFSDAIHTTETGDRLRAWVVFQQLAPIVRRLLDSGTLPRAVDPERLPPLPSLEVHESTTRCGDPPSQKLVRVDGAIALETASVAYTGASVRYTGGVEIGTAALAMSHAARIPLWIPPEVPAPFYVRLRAQVAEGAIDLSIPDPGREHPQIARKLTPTAVPVDVWIPVPAPERARELIVANAAQGGAASKMVIEEAALMALTAPRPRENFLSLDLAGARSAAAGVAMVRDRMGIEVTTLPDQYAQAVRFPLASKGAGLTLHVRARVVEGNAGFAILSADGKRYLEERAVWASPRTIELILPMPVSPAREMVILNRAAGGVRSKVVVESIEIRRPR